MERQQIHFSGNVQGVGFRYTTHQIASQFSVTGYVKNLNDGRVLVVAEGNPQELADFIRTIENRMDGYVRHVEQQRSTATGEFDSFSIQR
jgi:acylphosphatase